MKKYNGKGYTCETIVSENFTTESCLSIGSSFGFGEVMLSILVITVVVFLGAVTKQIMSERM